MPSKKKWTVLRNDNTELTVEAETVQLFPDQARVTFYVGDEPVASFVGVNGYWLV